MATLNYQFVSVCGGGGHVTIHVTFNTQERDVIYTTDELREPLANLTIDQRETLALLILKVHFAGMTRAQMASALQSPGGVTVTV